LLFGRRSAVGVTQNSAAMARLRRRGVLSHH